MNPFFILAGFCVGLVFHATLASAVIWVVLQTSRRGTLTGLALSTSFALAQAVLAFVACAIIFNLGPFGLLADPALRILASLLFTWMAFKVYRAPKIQSLDLPSSPTPSLKSLATKTFRQSLSMPYRLAAWIALPIVLNTHLRSPGLLNAGLTAFGVFLAGLAWFLFFTSLTHLFFHRVPQSITLHSLNKLRLLAFTIFLGYAIIGFTPLFVRF